MDQNENLEQHQSILEANAFLDDEAISGPLLTSDLVVRGQLLELMNRQRQRPFTLVSAPAGYGKTTLVNNWLESVDYPCTSGEEREFWRQHGGSDRDHHAGGGLDEYHHLSSTLREIGEPCSRQANH